MKKKIIAIVAVLCIVCLSIMFVACDGTEKDKQPSGNAPSGSIESGDNIPSGTVIIDGNQPPKQDYDDEDIDYSQALIIEDNEVKGLTDYGITLSRIVIPDGVTSIGEKAFFICDKQFPFNTFNNTLTSVVMPSRESISDLHPTNSYRIL